MELSTKVLDSVAAGRPAPCYLLYGGEGYLVEDTAKKLIERLVPPEQKDFCLEVLSGTSVTPAQFAAAVATLPLFGGGRVVWLRGCGIFKSGERASAFLTHLAQRAEGVTIVITEESADRRTALYKELETRGAAYEFEPLSDTDDGDLRRLYDCVTARLRNDGVAITRDALFYLVQLVGTDLRLVFTEIEKLSLHAVKGAAIGRDDIELLVTPSRETEAFQLADAVASGNPRAALAVLKRILAQGADPGMILGTLTRRMRSLLQAKELMSSGAIRWPVGFPAFKELLERVPRDVRETFRWMGREQHKRYSLFGQHPYAAYKICEAARPLALRTLRARMDRVVRADVDLKGGRRSKAEALEDLVLTLCGTVTT